MDINFELYKIFYYTAREGSFSKAAKLLYISQSAVSQAIGSLEEKIGSRLFIRKARNIQLTSEGTMLYVHVEQAYNFIRTAEEKLLEMQSLDLGEIRIGAGDTVCRYFLAPYLERFIAAYPKIKIRVINRTSPQIIEILKKGQIDLGIITLPIKDDSISIKNFKKVEDKFVSSSRFGELKNKTVPVSELACYPLLLLEKSSATRRNLDEYFRAEGLSITPEIELESMELLVEFSRIGLGIAHVLKESAETLIKSGELFFINTLEKLPEHQLGIATVKNVPLSNASSRFIELLDSQV
jgi:DNA-binding transcriptional LysR family regulator